MIKLGSVRYLPALNFSLTPFGSQYHLVNYFRYKQKLFLADFSLGDNTFANFYGMSLKGKNLIDHKIWGLNFGLDIWNQPELELTYPDTRRFLIDIWNQPVVSPDGSSNPNKIGGAFKVDFTCSPFNLKSKLGLFVQTGYKTKGYTAGEQLNQGFIVRYGLSSRL